MVEKSTARAESSLDRKDLGRRNIPRSESQKSMGRSRISWGNVGVQEGSICVVAMSALERGRNDLERDSPGLNREAAERNRALNKLHQHIAMLSDAIGTQSIKSEGVTPKARVQPTRENLWCSRPFQPTATIPLARQLERKIMAEMQEKPTRKRSRVACS